MDPRTPGKHATLAELHVGAEQYVIDTLDLYGPELLQAEIPLIAPQEFPRMPMEGAIVTPLESIRKLGVEDDFCGFPLNKVYATA